MMKAVNQDENITSGEYEPIDLATTSERGHATSILNNVYAKPVIPEGEPSLANI